jgi:predicted HTH domain antitoxin
VLKSVHGDHRPLTDDLAQQADPGRRALEALALDGYRSGAFTQYEAAQILGMSRLEFEGLLKQRNVQEHAYDVEDFEDDLRPASTLKADSAIVR